MNRGDEIGARRARRNGREEFRIKIKKGGLEEFEFGEILEVDHADGLFFGVDDDEVVDVALVEDGEGIGGEGGIFDADGVGSHDFGEGAAEDGGVGGHVAAEIAVGEDAGEFAAFVDDAEAAGLGAGHDEEGFFDGNFFGGDGVAVAGAHDVADAEKERAADGTGGMMLGEFFFGETAGVEEGHGEGVAEGEHGGGAGSGREIERAGFLGNFDVEDEVAVAGEGGFGRGGETDDGDGKALESGEEIEEFLGFAGVAEREDDVAVVEDAEVAVERIDAVEDDRGGAGAGEGGGDFLADVAGLADADDDDFALGAEGAGDGVDGELEGVIQLGADRFEAGDLDIENFARAGEMIHGGKVVWWRRGTQMESVVHHGGTEDTERRRSSTRVLLHG